jgi:hypothetical protein
MFYRHVYDEEEFSEPSEEEIKNKHVKIVVRDRKDMDKFDKYVTRVEKFGPTDLSIVESNFDATITLDETIDETKSTLEVLVDAAEKLPDDGVKQQDIAKLLKDLYLVSQEMETE